MYVANLKVLMLSLKSWQSNQSLSIREMKRSLLSNHCFVLLISLQLDQLQAFTWRNQAISQKKVVQGHWSHQLMRTFTILWRAPSLVLDPKANQRLWPNLCHCQITNLFHIQWKPPVCLRWKLLWPRKSSPKTIPPTHQYLRWRPVTSNWTSTVQWRSQPPATPPTWPPLCLRVTTPQGPRRVLPRTGQGTRPSQSQLPPYFQLCFLHLIPPPHHPEVSLTCRP